MWPTRAELKEGMTTYAYFRAEVLRQRHVWDNKPSLRRMYQQWFARVGRYLPEGGPVVEIGCGAGGFKQWRPSVISSDLVASPWLNLVVDAIALPFASGSVAAVVAFDVLHHVPRPLTFLREVGRVLRSGGRAVFFEPAITPWSRMLWGLFHHEPVDLACDPFQIRCDPGAYFANTALPYLLFQRHGERLARELPEMTLEVIEHSDFLVYPLTGGFTHFSLLPAWAVAPLYQFESVVLRRIAARLTAVRLLAVFRRA